MELISEHCKQTADLCKEKSSTYMSLSLHAIVLIQDAANKVGALPLKVHFLSTESNRYWNVNKKMSNFQEKCSNFCQKLTVQNGCKRFCVHSWVELSYENKSENANTSVKNAKNHKSFIHRHNSKSGGLLRYWPEQPVQGQWEKIWPRPIKNFSGQRPKIVWDWFVRLEI